MTQTVARVSDQVSILKGALFQRSYNAGASMLDAEKIVLQNFRA
jgi:hypothetical protein